MNESTPHAGAGAGAVAGSMTVAMYLWRFANVQFNEATHELQVAGTVVQVEPRPLRLLTELLHHANEVVTKEELFEAVWEGRVTVDNVLANAVNKLRRALGEEGGERVVNVPRVGYRLVGALERIGLGEQPLESLALRVGLSVPGRPGFVLQRQLNAQPSSPVWLAMQAKTHLQCVFKFAADAHTLRTLKREFTLSRLLRLELGTRDDLVPVREANFSAAPYFLEYEFAGEDLLRWAEHDNRLSAMPLADRLALLVQIAQAVAAAHSVSVLHRDIKPANILMALSTQGWQPQLIDFGSGRMLDPQRLGQLGVTALGLTIDASAAPGSLTGTPLYLAPELLAGQAATVQSDVYALGVLLYQLLVGDLRRPLATGWERDIPDRMLALDISAATDREPAQRLATPLELVRRLQSIEARHNEVRNAQVQQAQHAQALEALRHQRARRPWVVAFSVALLGGLVASVLFAIQARQDEHRALDQAKRAETLYGFLAHDLFKRSEMAQIGDGAAISVKRLLDAASARAQHRFKEQPQSEAEIAYVLGDLYMRAGVRDGALKNLRRAVELLEPKKHQADLQPLHDRSLATLAFALALIRDSAGAQSALAKVSPLAARDPVTRLHLASAKVFVAYDEQAFEKAVPLAKALVEVADGLPPELADLRIIAWSTYGDILYRMNRFDEAQTVFDNMLKPPFDMVAAGPIERLRTELSLAKAKMAKSQTAGLDEEMNRIRDTAFKLNGPRDQIVLNVDTELGRLHEDLGNFEKSAFYAQRAYAGKAAAYGENHPITLVARVNVGVTELRLGRSAQALDNLDAARKALLASAAKDETDPRVQTVDFTRAQALLDLRRAPEAWALLSRLDPDKIAQAAPGPDWATKLEAERGRAALLLGRKEEGRQRLRQALAEMEAKGTPEAEMRKFRALLGKS